MFLKMNCQGSEFAFQPSGIFVIAEHKFAYSSQIINSVTICLALIIYLHSRYIYFSKQVCDAFLVVEEKKRTFCVFLLG